MGIRGRRIFVGAMVCGAVALVTLALFPRNKNVAAAGDGTGQWVDPANPTDELVDGPYKVDPDWPKPFAELFPEEKGWTWGAVQGIFVQNPDRIFVAMRGELPDISHVKPTFVEVTTDYGMKVHLQVPIVGLYPERVGWVVRQSWRTDRHLQG